MLSRGLIIENAVFARRVQILIDCQMTVSEALGTALSLCREPGLQQALLESLQQWAVDPAKPLGREWKDQVLTRTVQFLLQAGVMSASLGMTMGKASEQLFDFLTYPAGTEKKWEFFREQYFFFSQLHLLGSGGVSLTDAMYAVSKETPGEQMRRLAVELDQVVLGGGSMLPILEDHAKYFDAGILKLLKEGEEAGNLTDTLGEIRRQLSDRLGYRAALAVSRAGQPAIAPKLAQRLRQKIALLQKFRAEHAEDASDLPLKSLTAVAGDFEGLGIHDLVARAQALILEEKSWVELFSQHPEVFAKWEVTLLARGEKNSHLDHNLAGLVQLLGLDL